MGLKKDIEANDTKMPIVRKAQDYYLTKGFDRPTAEYFANGRRTIVDVIPNDDYTLTLNFGNGEQRLLDMKPMLNEETVFKPLCNIDTFKRVYLDTQHCVSWDIDPTVDSKKVWNNKIDLSSDSCYIDSVPINSHSEV